MSEETRPYRTARVLNSRLAQRRRTRCGCSCPTRVASLLGLRKL